LTRWTAVYPRGSNATAMRPDLATIVGIGAASHSSRRAKPRDSRGKGSSAHKTKPVETEQWMTRFPGCLNRAEIHAPSPQTWVLSFRLLQVTFRSNLLGPPLCPLGLATLRVEDSETKEAAGTTRDKSSVSFPHQKFPFFTVVWFV
jgi:hypothetical protein